MDHPQAATPLDKHPLFDEKHKRRFERYVYVCVCLCLWASLAFI